MPVNIVPMATGILSIRVRATTATMKFDGTVMVTLRVNRPLVINKRRNCVPDTEVYWGEDSDDALRTWYNV